VRRSTVGGIDAPDTTRDAAIGDTMPHMSGVALFAACIAFTAVRLGVGIQRFRRGGLS
jgi:hypothetical protein